MRVRMRRAVLVLVVLSVASACTATYVYLQFVVVRERAAYRDVSLAEARAMMESTSSLLILDVSSEGEYAQGHLKGAINIPLSDLLGRMNELDTNSPILVYCRTGKRGAQACSALIEHGFSKVYNMEGGLLAWIDSGYPVVTEKIKPTYRTRAPRIMMSLVGTLFELEDLLNEFSSVSLGQLYIFDRFPLSLGSG